MFVLQRYVAVWEFIFVEHVMQWYDVVADAQTLEYIKK